MSTEQKKFKAWLLSQPPEEILHHANQYMVREDILMWFDVNNLELERASAMLKSSCPLQDICEAYMKMDVGSMDMIREAIITHADKEAAKMLGREKPVKRRRRRDDPAKEVISKPGYAFLEESVKLPDAITGAKRCKD